MTGSVLADGAGRYSLHDLVRVFAADRSRDIDPGAVRRQAVVRLLDHYRWLAVRAAVAYAPHEVPADVARVENPGTDDQGPASREEAAGWLDRERVNLIAAAGTAVAAGSPRHATDLSAALHYYLDMTGHFREAEVLHERAVAGATDDAALERAHNNLGCVYWRLGRYAEGRDRYGRALELARRSGNDRAVGKYLANVTLGHFRLGRYQEALDCAREALTLVEATGSPGTVSTVRAKIGWCHLRLGRPEAALDQFRRALVAAEELGDSTFEKAYGLTNLAQAYERLHDLDAAGQAAGRALAMSRTLGFPIGESDALNALGRVARAAGEPHRAVELHREAVALTVRTGSRALCVEIRNELAASLAEMGTPEAAYR